MTTTEHTPGPWQHRESDFDPTVWEIIADCCESPLAEVPRWEDEEGNDSEEAKANRAAITAVPALVAACNMIVTRWERGNLAEAARACQSAVELATGNGPPWDITAPGIACSKPYSVLLLYPDYANDDGTESFYAFVEATGPVEAVSLAQRQAVAANDCVEIEPDDFVPLLVTQGHHYGEPLFNK